MNSQLPSWLRRMDGERGGEEGKERGVRRGGRGEGGVGEVEPKNLFSCAPVTTVS